MADIQQRIEAILAAEGVPGKVDWQLSGLPFLSEPGRLTEAVRGAIRKVNGVATRASTGGGTSDGRFIARPGTEVVELGPVNATIHKIDECIRLDELAELEAMYREVLYALAAP